MHNGGLPVVDRAMQSYYYQEEGCIRNGVHSPIGCVVILCSSVGDQQAERRAIPRRQEIKSVQYA